MEFKPGDKLKSKNSGHRWIVHETDKKPSELLADCIPVRHIDWPETSFIWQDPHIFERNQDAD